MKYCRGGDFMIDITVTYQKLDRRTHTLQRWMTNTSIKIVHDFLVHIKTRVKIQRFIYNIKTNISYPLLIEYYIINDN